MRVAVVLNSLYTGGAEFSTLSFYGWMVQRGHTVKVVCLKKAAPAYDCELFGLPEVHFLAGTGFFASLRSLMAVIREFRPVLVHSVLFEANLLTRFARLRNSSFVHAESLVNEMYSEYRLRDPRIKPWKLMGYKLVDRVTQQFGVDHFHANGRSVAKHYQHHLGINPNRVTIVPRGRKANPFLNDDANRKKVRHELGTGGRVLISTIGRHEFQKGHDTLLDALPLLGEWLHEIQVVIIGREGNFTPAILERIERYQLQTRVVLTGHRDDVSSLLAASDVFVFPSRFEGLPGSLIEAEAAGLPIVCSAIDNNREVVEEGANAILFLPDHPQALADALRVTLLDESLRERMGRHSLVLFQTRFALEQIHRQMEALLIRLSSSGS